MFAIHIPSTSHSAWSSSTSRRQTGDRFDIYASTSARPIKRYAWSRIALQAGSERASSSSAQRLTIGKLAPLADVSANAVRFYEREGLRRRNFRGQVVMMFFGFTNCPDTCPTTMTEMAQGCTSWASPADGCRAFS